jgi:hypothetical protein
MHDEHFGTKVTVVDRQARNLLGLFAIEEGDPYVPHHFFPSEDDWKYKHESKREDIPNAQGINRKRGRIFTNDVGRTWLRGHQHGVPLDGVQFQSTSRPTRRKPSVCSVM